jgi:hypothetical protein
MMLGLSLRGAFLGGALVLSLAVAGCGGVTLLSSRCDGGKQAADGRCIVDVSDGAAEAIVPSCGPGTELVGTQCVPSSPPPDGPAPTPDAGGGAGPDASADVGVDADGGADARADIGGSVDADAGSDAAMAQFIVRVNVTTLGADGFSSIPVVILGTDAAGNPSTDRVVLGVSRAGAGTLTPSTVTLTQAGAMAYFTPCSAAASTTCVGKVRVTLALASAPTVILAQSQEITLVAPEGVGSDAPCRAGGNVLFFNGDAGNYIFTGLQTVTRGTWNATSSSTQVHINVMPTDPKQGLWWDVYFDASKLTPPLLTTQVYDNAQRWPFQATDHPGLDVGGDGRGCNMVTGRFQIEDLTLVNGDLKSFTATFEHHCEGKTSALRGCVHFEM